MAATRVRLVIPSGDRRTGHPMQVPGVRRIDVPGGIGWCFDQDVVVHKDALSWTIPGQSLAILDDSSYALDFAHTWLIYCFDNDGVLHAAKREDLGVLGTGPDINVIAWVDTHYDLLPRLKGCISFVDPADPIVRLLAGNGGVGFSGDGGDPKEAEVFHPTSVIRHPTTKEWYIGSRGAVRKVSADESTITTVAGTGVIGHDGDGGRLAKQLHSITGVAFDADGKMWLADQDETIDGHDPMGEQFLHFEDTDPFVFPFVTGYWAYENYTPSPSLYTGTGLGAGHADSDLAINPDAYDSIRVVDFEADTITSQHHSVSFPTTTSSVEGGPNPYPWIVSLVASLAIGTDGTVYISNGYDVGLFTAPDVPIDPWTGHMYVATVTPGVTEITKLLWKEMFYPPTPLQPFTLDTAGGPAWGANDPASVNNRFAPPFFPQQVWPMPNGDLYWADSRTNQVWKRTAGGGYEHIFGNPIGVHSTQFLLCPVGVAVDGGGNVFVCDTKMNVVYRVAPDGSYRVVIGQSGNRGFSPAGLPASETILNRPTQLWVSRCGQLVVCDTGNNRVLALGCPC